MDKQLSKFNARVLVVENYAINAELTTAMLKMMKCKVDVAENGREALLFLTRFAYDIIFMDIEMPILDGCQTTIEIRKNEQDKKHIPIIALTANALAGDQEKYMSCGMDGFINKPLKFIDLEFILNKFIPNKKVE
jgi:CheY-like chemotaxis protein